MAPQQAGSGTGGRPPSGGAGGETTRVVPGDVSTDEAYRILRHPRSRLILGYFSELLGTETSAEHVTEYVLRKESERGLAPSRGQIEVDVNRHYLPRLDSRGIVEHDPHTGTVRYLGSETVERIMAVAIDEGDFP